MNITANLASTFIPWIARTILYHFGFRWRKIRASFLTILVVAGAPLVVRFFLPVPMSSFVFFVVSVGVGVYLCKQYTDGKLYPDIVGIVAGIEFISSILIDRFIIPLFL